MLQVMADVIGGFTLSQQELLTLANDLGAITSGMAFPVPLELFGLTPYGRGMQARRRVERMSSHQLELYCTASIKPPYSLLQVCYHGCYCLCLWVGNRQVAFGLSVGTATYPWTKEGTEAGYLLFTLQSASCLHLL